MGILRKIVGPRSKYDRSIPYTYEARISIIDGSDEYNSYFSDTICGLVEYLHKHGIRPDEVKVLEIYQDRELAIDARLFTSNEREWLFKPEICRAFEQHYEGHIWGNACSFDDRDRVAIGP